MRILSKLILARERQPLAQSTWAVTSPSPRKRPHLKLPIANNKTCNCRQKNTCPLDGNCLQSSVIYQATVTRKDNNTTETYIGLTENDFKTRYRNHTSSFRHAKHRNSTELSKHIWTLKDNNIEHFISWRILSSHSPYNSSSKRCNLCLKEKFLIICRPELSTLNKRNELVSSCRHRNKALLRNN